MMTSEERARVFLEHKQKYMAPLKIIDLVNMLDEHASEQRQMCADAAVKAFADWNFGRPQSLDAALIDACQNAG